MRSDNNQKMWALYGDKEMAYSINRNPEEQPSIEEMTRKAIDRIVQEPEWLLFDGRRQ